MTCFSARSMPNGTIWVPASQATSSMMNGQYPVMPSPYSPPAGRPGSLHGYHNAGKYPAGNTQASSRYGGQQHRSASNGARLGATSPTSYIYTSNASPHLAHAPLYAQQARQHALSPPSMSGQSGYGGSQPYRGPSSSSSRFPMRRTPSGSQHQQPLW
jgi:hypothetical protein